MSGVAVVTGASSGIGEAVARRLVQDGYRVAGLARRANRLEDLQAELGETFRASPCDLADAPAVRSVFDDVVGELGPLDVVVCNAGVGYRTSLLDGTPEQWRDQLEINSLAAMTCARLGIDRMSKRGHVVFMGSMSGHRVPTGGAMYAASKFALRALAIGLRDELRAAGRLVRVSHISPGVVDTRFALPPDHPGRRDEVEFEPLRSEDIADIVGYVLAAPPHVDITDVMVRPTGQRT